MPVTARAAAANRRLEIAVRERAESVFTSVVADAVLITAGIQPLFAITPADVDTAGGETVGAVAARAAQETRKALAEIREARDPRRLARGGVLALLATATLVLVLRLIGRGERALVTLAEPVARRRAQIGGIDVIAGDRLARLVHRGAQIAGWGVRLAALYVFLAVVLSLFPWTRPWGERLGTFLRDTLSEIGLGLLHGIPGLFTVVVILYAARLVAHGVRVLFDGIERGALGVPGVHRETAGPTRRIVVVLVWIVAIAVAYPHLPGANSEAFKGLSVLVGVMLSLGSAGIVNQIMSGFTLMYARALREGDYVRIGDTEGTVLELSALSTKVRTVKNEEVTIPNAVVVGTSTMNFTRLHAAHGTIVYTSVTIGYDAPWRQVHAMLLEAVERTPGVRREPAPYIVQRALADFYVEYQVNAYIERPGERFPVLSALHANIQDLFNEHGVQIMSPHFEQQPAKAVVVPRDRFYAPPARPPRGAQ
jgi:small-conductance mechanosensitive channel